MHIAVAGAGWSGCHIALELAGRGHRVVLIEREADIFNGVSGSFGIRLHKGPHYPRSRATRDLCATTLQRFCARYPELVVTHEAAVYAHGTRDAIGQPSKVSGGVFDAVCHESPECRRIDPPAWGYRNMGAAYDLDEPSAVLGVRLRDYFRARLAAAGVEVRCRRQVLEAHGVGGRMRLALDDGGCVDVDRLVNATGYQSLVPPGGPVLDVVYQVCLGLQYEDSQPGQKPISFIVMDGWFPCLMPCVDDHEPSPRHYVLTHGSYTILGSFPTPGQAQALLDSLDDAFVESRVRPLSEQQMCRFWPGFRPRFRYAGWKGVVLAKLRTRSEFRSSVVFEQAGIIHVFPGKITHVLQAGDEVLALLEDRGCVVKHGLRHVRGGVLDRARCEIADKPRAGEANTADLQTHEMLRTTEHV
ncbi:FAD-dependent oxidoreductase [Pseudomonas wadenswilerensis]